MTGPWREVMQRGTVIPAHPLALTASRRLDERHQRGLTRYYLDAGAGGVAVGVHTTQFAIRDKRHGLLRPVLALAAETVAEWEARHRRRIVRIAGVVGRTRQALTEARMARDLKYDLGLLSLGALRDADEDALIAHARIVAEIIPVMGFYLQPAVGGRRLSYAFWRRFVEIPGVTAIKIAPFNRYDTWDVVRAVADAGAVGRIALHTGNDDSILTDLLTTYQVRQSGSSRNMSLRMRGGLLGHWAFWTRTAVQQLRRIHRLGDRPVPSAWLTLAARVTDVNGAVFDAANGFHGCIPGIHEILRRQGLLRGRWCLDPREELSPGQLTAIDRVVVSYPALADDTFVREHLDDWLR